MIENKTLKICKKCNHEKTLDNFYFYKSKNYRDGFCNVCRNECNKQWRRNSYTNKEFYIRENLLKENKNICFICEIIKPLDAFRKSNHVKTGYNNTCKACFSIRDKNMKLKKGYGINLNIFNNLLEKQNNKCEICQIEFNNPSEGFVDHDHKTGKIRGLLCNSCNRGIGLLKDNVNVLLRAVKYIKNSSI